MYVHVKFDDVTLLQVHTLLFVEQTETTDWLEVIDKCKGDLMQCKLCAVLYYRELVTNKLTWTFARILPKRRGGSVCLVQATAVLTE